MQQQALIVHDEKLSLGLLFHYVLMEVNMKLSILCLAVFYALIYCDQTVWSYDLTTLPDGWSSTGGWEFDSTGAHIDIEAMGGIRGNHSIYTEMLFVPEGADSLTLFAPQYISGGGSDGAAYSFLKVNLNEEEPFTLWGYSWYDSFGTYTQPIVAGVDVVPGDSLSFYFGCDVFAYGSFGWADLYWHICDLELVLHDDIQVLNGVSWGLLKTLYY